MSYFAHRPVFAMVISIVIVIVGLIAMQGLPMAQYPDITPPEVEIKATYTGASAVDVEESVATPIEQKVNGVEHMIYMRSTNASRFRIFTRLNAWPFPGLTNSFSRIAHGSPSSMIFNPPRNSLVP